MWMLWSCDQPCAPVDWLERDEEGCESAELCCDDGFCQVVSWEGRSWDCDGSDCTKATEAAALKLCLVDPFAE